MPYLKELAPYVSGPTTVQFGSTGIYQAEAALMRQLPTFQWYQDGQALAFETRGAYVASFATAGSHQVAVKTTSAIGTVFWNYVNLNVVLPDGCPTGGGGIPLTSCPPQ
jgi:hypothetical protein